MTMISTRYFGFVFKTVKINVVFVADDVDISPAFQFLAIYHRPCLLMPMANVYLDDLLADEALPGSSTFSPPIASGRVVLLDIHGIFRINSLS
jgi:uncharacterized glyoxalase superfamily metalloenzyme YdcJ